MLSANFVRCGGLAALVGGVIGILYFPFHATATSPHRTAQLRWMRLGWRPGPRHSLARSTRFSPSLHHTRSTLPSVRSSCWSYSASWRAYSPSTLDKSHAQGGWRSGASVFSSSEAYWAPSARSGSTTHRILTSPFWRSAPQEYSC